jgi:hypothetical protein
MDAISVLTVRIRVVPNQFGFGFESNRAHCEPGTGKDLRSDKLCGPPFSPVETIPLSGRCR